MMCLFYKIKNIEVYPLNISMPEIKFSYEPFGGFGIE